LVMQDIATDSAYARLPSIKRTRIIVLPSL
jgi:hypothetical protein